MISLPLRNRRKLIVGGLALLALPAMIYFFHSLKQRSERFDEVLELKRDKLIRYRQKVLEKKDVSRTLAGFQSTFKQAQAALLTGTTPSLAAAEIQQILTQIANATGAQIMTERILQPHRSAQEMYLAIPVELTINCTMQQLTQLLYRIDRSAKLLRIAKLGINSRAGYGRLARRASAVNIVTTLTVEGFVKKRET